MQAFDALAAAIGADESGRKALQGFAAKVDSLVYTRQSRAASDGLKPFSSNPVLMAAMREHVSARVASLGANSTIIEDWCMVVCLVQESSPASLAVLEALARSASQRKDAWRLGLLVRYLGQYEDQPDAAALLATWAPTHASLLEASSAARWADALGLKRPAAGKSWQLHAVVSDRERPARAARAPDGATLVELQVFAEPMGADPDSFWFVKVSDASGGTMLFLRENALQHCELNDGQRLVDAGPAPSLAEVPAFIRRLQGVLGVQFLFSALDLWRVYGLRQKDAQARVCAWLGEGG
jgi:hypothetical protein